jgi:hypothetical protein
MTRLTKREMRRGLRAIQEAVVMSPEQSAEMHQAFHDLHEEPECSAAAGCPWAPDDEEEKHRLLSEEQVERVHAWSRQKDAAADREAEEATTW